MEPTASRRQIDAPAVLLGWGLLLGGVLALLVWVPLWLVPGGFAVIDAPTFREGLDTGLRTGTVATVLVVLAVGCTVQGLTVLRRGRPGVDVRLMSVVLGSCALAALTQQRWLLTAVTLTTLAVVVWLHRLPAPGH